MIPSRLFRAICLAFALVGPAAAQDAPADLWKLTLQGAGDAEILDLAMLQAMPVSEFETSTVWTDGVGRFAGVALSDLIETLGGEGDMLHATAGDGYAVEIPVSDAVPGGPILAYMLNGELLAPDEMGPYWIVYPYYSDPAYRSEEIEARSIWQLNTLRRGD